MIDQLAQSKIALQKTPITIEEDLVNLERDAEEELAHMMEDLEIFFEPLTLSLFDVINPVLKSPDEEETAPLPGGAKGAVKKDDKKQAPAKAAPAKGSAKGGELAAYESNLPLPTSGIESLILLIDNRIESLPIENLKVFGKIPVVARDFNLHLYMNRVKTIGH